MIKKIPTRKCLVCKTRFEIRSNTHWICSPECARVKGNEAVEKKKAELKKSDWTKQKAEIKEKLKTHSDYLKILQAVFNTYIRKRDELQECISCGCKMQGKKGDASHFYSVGSYPNLRFNEDNVHLSCVHCNQHLHGNIHEYRRRLPARIGELRFERLLDTKKEILKLSIPEINDLIKYYKQKTKELAA